jgi:hypothetical protein
MNRSRRIALTLPIAVAMSAIAGLGSLPAADDAKPPEKVIPAAQVREHVGKECTALMTVKASKNATPRRT